MKKLCLCLLLFCNLCMAKSLTVVLDWFPNPNHAPIFVAQQQGYFKANGLQVNIITPANPEDPVKLVASGHADIALDYQPNVLEQEAHGLPITQVGTLIATPLTSIITLQSSHIHTLHDLKGQSIAGSASDLVSTAMLRHNGLTSAQYHMIDVGYNLVQALLSGRVVAASGMDRNVEMIELLKMGKKIRVFYPEDNGVPIYSGLVYIANKQHAHDPAIQAFLRAVSRAAVYLINHPEQCWQKFAKQHPAMNNSTVKAEWFATLPRFALRPMAVDPARATTYRRFMGL